MWHPIETAPTDKDCIFFQSAKELFKNYNLGPFMAIGTWDGEYFSPATVNGYEWETEMCSPTHWMELPNQP